MSGLWTNLYNKIGPAGINPWTSIEIYGKGALGTQWYRLQAANKSNVDDLTATLNQDLLIKAEKEISAKKKHIDKIANELKFKEKNPALRKAAEKALAEEKRKLTKFGKQVKKTGKRLIRKQMSDAEQEYQDMLRMGGLGYRPDYQAVQSPAMKGWLVDIYGTYSNGLGQVINKSVKRKKGLVSRLLDKFNVFGGRSQKAKFIQNRQDPRLFNQALGASILKTAAAEVRPRTPSEKQALKRVFQRTPSILRSLSPVKGPAAFAKLPANRDSIKAPPVSILSRFSPVKGPDARAKLPANRDSIKAPPVSILSRFSPVKGPDARAKLPANRDSIPLPRSPQAPQRPPRSGGFAKVFGGGNGAAQPRNPQAPQRPARSGGFAKVFGGGKGAGQSRSPQAPQRPARSGGFAKVFSPKRGAAAILNAPRTTGAINPGRPPSRPARRVTAGDVDKANNLRLRRLAMSLGQIFSPPNYGQLLPASYQAEPSQPYGSGNPYAANEDLYTQPWYYSYWRYLLPGRQIKLP